MSWGEGSMNWAELRDLVDHLPDDSATKAASGGDVQGRRWSQSTYILAAQYNALLLMIRVLWAAHLKGDPPDMSSIDPPQLEADEQRVELEAAAARRSEALLNRYSPGRADDQTAIDHWVSKIRALETQQ